MEIILTIYGIGCISTMFIGINYALSDEKDKIDPPRWVAAMMIICMPGFVVGAIIGSVMRAIFN